MSLSVGSMVRRSTAGCRLAYGVAALFVSALLPLNTWALEFADVVEQAKQLAGSRYVAPVRTAPESLTAIDYPTYQTIRQRPESWLWSEEATPFRLEAYHLGVHYGAPIELTVVDTEGARPVDYRAADFDFGKVAFDPASLEGSGIAGLRLRFPLNGPESQDPLASFLGASYFQMQGADQVPGAKARGLAVDTGLASGEQFPWFRKFWVVKPAPGDREITLYALLDAPGVSGAYRFVIHPGLETVADVDAELYFRTGVSKLGVAPLTSMFLYGNGAGPAAAVAANTLRPEVHDSDGLAIRTDTGEWIWRPLNNPRRLAISAFQLENPRGFGLMQRTRQFARYQDLKRQFEARPSVWVEPEGDWGKGRVELVEIPSTDETNDNVVAFWVPEQVPVEGEALSLKYRLVWSLQGSLPGAENLAQVYQTRRALGLPPGTDLNRKPDGTVLVEVDFVGEGLQPNDETAAVTVDLSHNGNAEIVQSQLVPNPAYQGYRLALRVKPIDASRPVELRAYLRRDEQSISEVWTYQIPPA